MQTAVKSATKWLINVANADPQKLNPMPYGFFKKALEKQIAWAKAERNNDVDFMELANIVRNNLLGAGIRVMADNTKGSAASAKAESNADLDFNSTFNPTASKSAPAFVLNLSAGTQSFTALFNWFYSVLTLAQSEKFLQVSLTATLKNH